MLGKRRRTTTENTASAGFSPTWYASAALMVAVILALVGLLIYIGVRPHSPTPAAAPPAAAPTNPGGVGTNPGPTPPTTATDPTRPTGCHTTGTDQTIPTGTPAGVSWSLAKGVAVPSSASDGPVLHTAAGVGYCYADTPLGALLAASNLGRGTGTAAQIQQDGNEHSAVPNEYSAQAAAQPSPPETGADTGAQLAGFRIISYSPSQASIALVISVTGNPGTYGVSTAAMEWNQGDWRVVLQPGPSPVVTTSSTTSLAGYVAWSGVS